MQEASPTEAADEADVIHAKVGGRVSRQVRADVTAVTGGPTAPFVLFAASDSQESCGC